jgi:Family of unknown function (DUF5686)/CarboxypepD_reg-like domain
MRYLFLLICCSLFCFSVYAQNFTIRGKVLDKKNSEKLGYANIRVLNTFNGTAANKLGEYELRLTQGKYILAVSYIGYKSDTITVTLNHNMDNLNFFLEPTNISLSEIIVRADENFADLVIKKAIEKKNKRNKFINNYEYEAYTKGIVESQNEINATGGSINLSLGVNDTLPLKIQGILETQSKGYFEKPDKHKEIILARKQTANFPPTINTLTSGRALQDFYEDKIRTFGDELPAPLSEKAIDYYYFNIQGTTSINNNLVYVIHLEPKDPSDPGFTGYVFITDSSYDLIKVDLGLNKAANPGGVLDSIRIYQQFAKYDSVYMPVDYRVYVRIRYLNLLYIGLELNSIVYNYKINTKIPEDVFSKAVVTVLPNADKKPSSYWQGIQSIPYTRQEKSAYRRIDSVSAIPVSFWDRFSWLSTSENITDNFSISGPLGIYHFDKVEGHALDFGLSLDDALDKRLNTDLDVSYGFSDKRFKQDFGFDYKLGDYRTYDIEFNAFNKIKPLFAPDDFYDKVLATILPLFVKSEVEDYYYTKGFNIKLSGDVFPVLNLSIGFSNQTDKDAYNHTNFSFFNREEEFTPNSKIFETKINSIKLGFGLDFRDYIENGFYKRRIFSPNSFITFGGDVTISDKKFLKSGLNFISYTLQSSGRINTYNSSYLAFRIYGMYTNGSLPYQMFYPLTGNIDHITSQFSFRTLNLSEVFGDRVVAVNLLHNFKDSIFRLFHIPGLEDWQIQLDGFLNIGWTELSNETRSILVEPVQTFMHPFYEAGFEISHPLIPLGLSFAWKLNYRNGDNFRIGLSSPIF